jgi:tetratricopeptide (TPR) repeat protein
LGVLAREPGNRPLAVRMAFAIVLLWSLLLPRMAWAEGEDCGDLRNAYGPYDYRTIPATPLSLVEAGHYTPNVEHLIKGQSGYLGADLDYTLRAIPNHHRAIVSMANLFFRDKKDPPKGARYTVDCWFDRAMRFAPDDPKIRTAHGYYLSRKAKYQEAVAEFRYALELGADDGNTHYNLGLAHFNLKQYDEALKEAKLADERGFPLQGLKNKLKAVDKWTD